MALASPPASRTADLAGLPESVRPVALAGQRVLPVPASLAGLLPGGGLRRGSTVAVAGSTSLALALVAGPSAAGSWCAAVGLPSLGLVAAAEVGVDLGRLALVAAPGADWAAVVAALLDALDVVVVRPPRTVRAADARRLGARARERGSVLVPLGRWDGADVRLSVASSAWEGVGQGAGPLRARRMEVLAEGRGAAARPRRARLWLPTPEGGVAPAEARTDVASAEVASAEVASADVARTEVASAALARHGHGRGRGPRLVEEAGAGAPAGEDNTGHGRGRGPASWRRLGLGPQPGR